MNRNNRGLHYNYDLAECNWLLKKGAKAIGCGIHDRTGNPFVVFVINKYYHDLDEQYKTEYMTNK